MRLTANVRHITGSTKHHVAGSSSMEPVELSPASRLELVEADGGFLLLRYSKDEGFAGDTWHPTLEEAKRQAQIEFAVPFDGWNETA